VCLTAGKEKPPKLIAGIIAGQRNATFLRMVYEAYRENYKPDRWDYNCAQVSYELAQKHPDLVHIEQRKLTTPDYLDRHLLFKEVINWSDLYVIHLMIQSHEWNWNPDTIKTMKSTLGEVLRYIYYGSPVMLHPQVTQIAPVTPSTVLP
jgi:hypothetical protein